MLCTIISIYCFIAVSSSAHINMKKEIFRLPFFNRNYIVLHLCILLLLTYHCISLMNSLLVYHTRNFVFMFKILHIHTLLLQLIEFCQSLIFNNSFQHINICSASEKKQKRNKKKDFFVKFDLDKISY